MIEKKILPVEWCKITGIEILDADGWDRKNFDVDWNIALTRNEFLSKALTSTCNSWPRPLLDEIITSWDRNCAFEKEKGQDPDRPLLTLIKNLTETPEIAGLLDAAKAMHSIYTSLQEAGFSKPEALTLVGQMVSGQSAK